MDVPQYTTTSATIKVIFRGLNRPYSRTSVGGFLSIHEQPLQPVLVWRADKRPAPVHACSEYSAFSRRGYVQLSNSASAIASSSSVCGSGLGGPVTSPAATTYHFHDFLHCGWLFFCWPHASPIGTSPSCLSHGGIDGAHPVVVR